MKETQNEYKVLIDMIADLEEQSKTYEDLLKSEIESLGYDTLIIRYISLKFKKEDIAYMDDEDLKKIYDKFHKGDEEEFDPEAIKDIIKKIFEIVDIRNEAASLRNEANNAIEEYTKYITSPEYIQKKKERLEHLKEMAEKETDEVEKKKVMKLIETLEATSTLSFLFTRLDKIGDKECESVINTYFDNNRSKYVIDRYVSKCKRLGFNPDIYKYFFNIEEKFLDEKYHVFNNLFLYYAMRFIAYADIDNSGEKMYCHALINNMTNLLYHKFPTQQDEDAFKALIGKLLDKFEYARDYFDKNNITHPNHPRRIEKDKEQEQELVKVLKVTITSRAKELNVETPDTDGKTVQELRDILKELDAVEDEQLKDSIPDIDISNKSEVIDSEAVIIDDKDNSDVDSPDSNVSVDVRVVTTDNTGTEVIDSKVYNVTGIADDDNCDDGSPL